MSSSDDRAAGQGKRKSRGSFRFYKIIIEDTLRQNKLLLPKKLNRRLQQGSRERSTQATLWVPSENGLRWDVELWTEQEQGRVWLRNGFHEFAEFYSLAHSHLLLFKHLRDFHFSVRVFDSSSLEIDHMIYSPPNSNPPTSDDDHNDEHFESESDQDSDYEISHGEFEGGRRSSGKKKMKNGWDEDARGSCSRCNGGHSGHARGAAKFSGAPSFRVTLTETYMTLRQAHIPVSFSERYLKKSDIVGLKVGEKVWEVKISKTGNPGQRKNSRITGGWTQFARDNNLNVGNVCIFKLLNPTVHPLLHVTILRSPDIF